MVILLLHWRLFFLSHRSRSGRSDSESQQGFQFPFLPSYEMAVNDTRLNQQSAETSTSNSSIDDGVIVDISRLRVDSSTENQSDTSETNRSSVDTSSVDTPLSNDTIDWSKKTQCNRVGLGEACKGNRSRWKQFLQVWLLTTLQNCNSNWTCICRVSTQHRIEYGRKWNLNRNNVVTMLSRLLGYRHCKHTWMDHKSSLTSFKR